MSRSRRIAQYTLLTFACMALTLPIASCGGDDGGTDPVDPGNPIELSGYVLKGDVVGAAVNVHTILATGQTGGVIAGPFTTDASGRWSGEVPSGTAGAYAVVATGGTYTDEATGNTVSLLSELRGVVIVGQGNVGNATPITHAIFDNAVYRVGLGASVDAAFISAIGDMTTAIGFDPHHGHTRYTREVVFCRDRRHRHLQCDSGWLLGTSRCQPHPQPRV